MSPPIPKTLEQTVIEYTQLEDTGRNGERKAGLKYALDSSGINRAHDKCIIMMSGETGVGKSSLTNHVFGLKLCRTSNVTSETKAATEFSLKVDLPRLKISDMQVSIVDTPGMCDTEGLGQDARNVRAIQKYVENSLGLGKYPNMILLLIKASDNRFVGKNSKLSKTIRSLGTLNIIDRTNPNLVIVITHIMGLGKKKWENKKQEIKKCVKDVCSIDAPVVFVENEPEDHDLEINERTGCSKLPNGDVQPHNVSEAILKQLDKNVDHLGHIALKEVYAKGDRAQNAKQTMQVVATDSQTPLSYEEQYIKKLLEDICDDSEIEAKLQECVEKDEIDKRDVGKIDQFCHKLVNEWGIRTFKELQKLTMQFLIELTGCELEDRARAKFAELFELDNSYSVPAACQELRKGFNVLVNDFTASPVFENFQDNKQFLQSLKKEDFGKTLFTGELYNSTDEFIKSYIVGMMKNDNFQMEKYKNIIGAIRPHPQKDKPGQQFLHCDWEIRIKQLDLPDPKQLKMTRSFLTAAQQLPEKCDFDDASSLQKFEDFCGVFGTHFVRKAFCGGLVQIGGYLNRIENDATNQIRDDLYKLTEHWNSKLSAAADTKRLAVFNFDIHISDSKRGNDEQKAKLSTKKSDEMHQWRFNLPKDMVVLKNHLEISPINELIKAAGLRNQAQAMDDALALILGDSGKISKIRAKQNEEREAREAEEKWQQQCREREEQRRLEEEREKLEDERAVA